MRPQFRFLGQGGGVDDRVRQGQFVNPPELGGEDGEVGAVGDDAAFSGHGGDGSGGFEAAVGEHVTGELLDAEARDDEVRGVFERGSVMLRVPATTDVRMYSIHPQVSTKITPDPFGRGSLLSAGL